jgi:hypothetical protein
MTTRACSICGREEQLSRSWCSLHYQRWRRNGDPTALAPTLKDAPCSVEGCEKPGKAYGMCSTHSRRFARNGDLGYRPYGKPPEDERERFERLHVVAPSGCWIWQGTVTRGGYGIVTLTGKRTVGAHRWAYEQLVGDIPEGLTLDHLCYVPLCVNPDHLEPVTPGENTRRAKERRMRKVAP